MTSKIITGLLLTIAIMCGVLIIQNASSNDTITPAPVAAFTPSPDVEAQLVPAVAPQEVSEDGNGPDVLDPPEGWSYYYNEQHDFAICYPTQYQAFTYESAIFNGAEIGPASNNALIMADEDPYIRAGILEGRHDDLEQVVQNDHSGNIDRIVNVGKAVFAEGSFDQNNRYVEYLKKLPNGEVFQIEILFPNSDRTKYLDMVKTMSKCVA